MAHGQAAVDLLRYRVGQAVMDATETQIVVERNHRGRPCSWLRLSLLQRQALCREVTRAWAEAEEQRAKEAVHE